MKPIIAAPSHFTSTPNCPSPLGKYSYIQYMETSVPCTLPTFPTPRNPRRLSNPRRSPIRRLSTSCSPCIRASSPKTIRASQVPSARILFPNIPLRARPARLPPLLYQLNHLTHPCSIPFPSIRPWLYQPYQSTIIRYCTVHKLRVREKPRTEYVLQSERPHHLISTPSRRTFLMTPPSPTHPPSLPPTPPSQAKPSRQRQDKGPPPQGLASTTPSAGP